MSESTVCSTAFSISCLRFGQRLLGVFVIGATQVAGDEFPGIRPGLFDRPRLEDLMRLRLRFSPSLASTGRSAKLLRTCPERDTSSSVFRISGRRRNRCRPGLVVLAAFAFVLRVDVGVVGEICRIQAGEGADFAVLLEVGGREPALGDPLFDVLAGLLLVDAKRHHAIDRQPRRGVVHIVALNGSRAVGAFGRRQASCEFCCPTAVLALHLPHAGDLRALLGVVAVPLSCCIAPRNSRDLTGVLGAEMS